METGTRKEQTGIRSSHFSAWIKDHLPDSVKTGFRVYDLDWIFAYKDQKTNRFTKIMMCEEKCQKVDVALNSDYRKLINEVLRPAMRKFCKENDIDFQNFN